MAKCGVCGVDVTFDLVQQYVPDFDGNKHRVCKNCSARGQGKALKYDPASGRVVFVDPSEIEIKKKCNVCGNVFCYNPVDLDKNRKKQSQAVFSALGSLGGAMSGHYAAAAVNQGNANQAMNAIVDYNKCPQCGSMDLKIISKEDLAMETNKTQPQPPQISVADELKKYKELLDMGVLTQEEFDAKKQELLTGTPSVSQSVPVSEPEPPVNTAPTRAVLTLTRPNQFFAVNPAFKVTVNNVPQADLRNNSSISINLPVGKHTVSIKQAFKNKVFDVDLKENATISVSWNRITGGIDVKPTGMVDMYIIK